MHVCVCIHIYMHFFPFLDGQIGVVLFIFLFLIKFFFLFRAAPVHMEVPTLGAEYELQLLAYTTATATPDP